MDATKWRISKACQTCRTKKIKCNGKTPCENCRLRSLQCLYREKARNRTRKIKERKAVDETNTSQGDGETPSFQPSDEGSNEVPASATAPDAVSAASPAPGFHGERSINNSSVAATHRASPNSCLLQLYYGPSSNFSLMNAIYHQIEGTRPDVSSREAVEEVGPGLDLFSHRRLFFGDSADNRPSPASSSDDSLVIALDQATASRLLDRYLLTYWHGAPVLSKATYRRRLDRLFKPPGILNFDSPDTIIVMLAVALGASMTGEEAIAQFLFRKAKQGIAKLDEVVNAQVVQIHLMMMSLPVAPFTNVPPKSERARPNSSFLHVGNAVRKAVAAGLHKNAYTQPWQTPEDVDQRRILFWSLFFWETWNCFVVGRPSSIPDPGQSVPVPKDQKLVISLVTLARIMDKCAKRIYSPRHHSLLPVFNAAMEIRRELHQFAEQQLKDMKFGLVGDPSTGELGLCQAIVSTMYHHTLLLTFRPFLILRAKLRQEKPSSSDATTSAAEGLHTPPPPWLDDACEYCLEAARNSIGFLAGSCANNILCQELNYHGFFIEGACYALAFDMLQEANSAHCNLPWIQSGLRCLRSMLRDEGTDAGANASQLPMTIASIEQMVRSVFPNFDPRDPKVDPDIRQLRSQHQQPVHSTTIPGSPLVIPVGGAAGEESVFAFPSMPFGSDVSQQPDGTYPWGIASEEQVDFTAADLGWDIDFGTMNMEAFLSLDPNEAFNFTS